MKSSKQKKIDAIVSDIVKKLGVDGSVVIDKFNYDDFSNGVWYEAIGILQARGYRVTELPRNKLEVKRR